MPLEGLSFIELSTKLATSPAIKLLRARRAPLIIGFLFGEYKINNRITILQSELRNKLNVYIAQVQDEESYNPFTDNYEISCNLIDEWCHESNRYVRRYLDEKGQPVIELSPDTEKVIRWMEELQEREFVGTESRFRDIFYKLTEIIDNSTADPQQKINELERRKNKIEAQIREIQRTGKVESFSQVQLQERFAEINKQARALLSDFSEVEENFKLIIKSIYQQQSDAKVQKGAILSYTLDATDELRNSPQGQSFYNFYQFLLADTGREHLRELVERVYEILQDNEVSNTDSFLLNLKSFLLRASQKTISTNHILSDRLNKLLSEQNAQERKKSISLIREIKTLLYNLKNDPPTSDEFIYIETEANICLPLERPLGERQTEQLFIQQASETHHEELEYDSLTKLFSQFHVDKEKLTKQVNQLLQHRQQITLGQVIHAFAVEQGLAEIITYYSIGASSSKHYVLDGEEEVIRVNDHKEVVVPKLIFTK